MSYLACQKEQGAHEDRGQCHVGGGHEAPVCHENEWRHDLLAGLGDGQGLHGQLADLKSRPRSESNADRRDDQVLEAEEAL